MPTVIVSPRYQIVIPLEVRKALGITPGQKVEVMRMGDCIEIIPLRPMKRLRGSLAGINTSVKREGD